ncbi:MAG: hypothetical protein SGILL_008807, partial [Bacillariaceae sp.]
MIRTLLGRCVSRLIFRKEKTQEEDQDEVARVQNQHEAAAVVDRKPTGNPIPLDLFTKAFTIFYQHATTKTLKNLEENSDKFDALGRAMVFLAENFLRRHQEPFIPFEAYFYEYFLNVRKILLKYFDLVVKNGKIARLAEHIRFQYVSALGTGTEEATTITNSIAKALSIGNHRRNQFSMILFKCELLVRFGRRYASDIGGTIPLPRFTTDMIVETLRVRMHRLPALYRVTIDDTAMVERESE